MKTGNVMIGSIGSTEGINPLGDIYIFGSYLPTKKGNRYYVTVKRLGRGKRQTLLTTQIFEKEPTSANLYKTAVKAASAAGLIPQYKTGDPVKFWEKNRGLKKNIVFDEYLYPKSGFNKSHRSEGRVTSI
jgi:hypothetical protein